MRVYIEVFVIFIILALIVMWKLWEFMSRKRLQKKYNPDDDKSRKGGIPAIGELRTTEQGTTLEPSSVIGFEQPERRELFQETDASDVREDSTSPGENSKPISRRFFRRKK
jgi:hypothetical protein